MRKGLRNATAGECTSCHKDVGRREPAAAAEPDCEDAVEGVWVCLQCGHQGCGRASVHKHALKHYETPRSNSHALVLHTVSGQAWCYDCDDEVDVDGHRKLKECAEHVRRLLQDSAACGSSQLVKRKSADMNDCDKTNNEMSRDSNAQDTKALNNKVKGSSLTVFPKVKGLVNLGNTCFFNAVMQNLSQTPVLPAVLADRSKEDVQDQLPGLTRPAEDDSPPSSSASSGEEDKAREALTLTPLSITLSEPGQLTQAVVAFLADMHTPGKSPTVTPNRLFGHVCKKVPRFKGYQQQDSHELLRFLLDGMKAEEVKRSQGGILKRFHAEMKSNKVEDDTKLKIKEYGRQVKYTFVDSLFGGHFLSTVLCEDCRTPSQIFEPFLDISLPITEEKAPRPGNAPGTKKKGVVVENGLNADEATSDTLPSKPSKHMSKKEKKQARQEAKRKKRSKKFAKLDDVTAETPAEADEELGAVGVTRDEPVAKTADAGSAEGTGSQDISDADIEDNLESEASRDKVSAAPESASPAPSDDVTALTQTVGELQLTDTAPAEAAKPDDVTETVKSDDVTAEVEPKPDDVTAEHEEAEDDISSTTQTPSSSLCTEGSSVTLKADSPAPLDAEDVEAGLRDVRAEQRHDAQIQAMSTLVPRYQPSGQPCSITSCLHQFTSAELLTGNNKFGCKSCSHRKQQVDSEGKKEMVYTNASKQVLIMSPPAILTLHLKRFAQGVSDRQHQVLYALYGLVEHNGRLNAGHYTAYVKVRANGPQMPSFLHKMDMNGTKLRHMVEALRQREAPPEGAEAGPAEGAGGEGAAAAPPGRWFYISDSRVTETSEAAVLRAQAYLLFYERIH